MGLLFNENNRPQTGPDSNRPTPYSDRKFEKPDKPKPGGLLDTLFSQSPKINKKNKKDEKSLKSVLEKRKEGLTWGELESEAKKRTFSETQLKESDRVEAIREMKREKGQKYGEHVDEKDIKDYMGDLKKDEYKEKIEEDRLHAKHEGKLLDKIRQQKSK